MAEFPGAIDYFVDPSRVFTGQNDKKAIVCHGTGSSDPLPSIEQLGDYFRSTPLETSVHYGIGRDGRIAQYVLESDGAGGNCCTEDGYDPFWDQFPTNKNLHTLSFETINDSSNSLALTDPQKQTMFKLVKYWVVKYKIPLSNIKSHASLDPINRARCPGPNFPWQELFDYLGGATVANSTTTPTGWNDDGTTLTAPNGVKVILGFRDFILDPKNKWNPDDYPMRPQYHASPLEHSNPSEGEGDALDCYLTRLGYTPEKGVFKTWVGQELVWFMGQQSKSVPATVADDVATLITVANKLKADLA
jgi:N-acetyl-anhydromuramyl-L-alanine amidase AmpD